MIVSLDMIVSMSYRWFWVQRKVGQRNEFVSVVVSVIHSNTLQTLISSHFPFPHRVFLTFSIWHQLSLSLLMSMGSIRLNQVFSHFIFIWGGFQTIRESSDGYSHSFQPLKEETLKKEWVSERERERNQWTENQLNECDEKRERICCRKTLSFHSASWVESFQESCWVDDDSIVQHVFDIILSTNFPWLPFSVFDFSHLSSFPFFLRTLLMILMQISSSGDILSFSLSFSLFLSLPLSLSFNFVLFVADILLTLSSKNFPLQVLFFTIQTLFVTHFLTEWRIFSFHLLFQNERKALPFKSGEPLNDSCNTNSWNPFKCEYDFCYSIFGRNPFLDSSFLKVSLSLYNLYSNVEQCG